MGVAAAAPWEKTGSFSRNPSETAAPPRQLLKTVSELIFIFESDPLITHLYLNYLYFVFPEEKAVGACPYSRTVTAGLSRRSPSFVWPRSLAGSRPVTATRPGVLSPPGSRPGSADSDLATVAVESSVLTHG